MNNTAEFLAGCVHNPYAAGTATIDIARGIDLHAIGNTRLIAAQFGENAVGVFCERAAGRGLMPESSMSC